MHGAVQTGGRSPKPLNGPNGSAQLKASSDNVQNVSSHAKSKKREHGVHNSEPVKRERLSKVDDADSGQVRPEQILKVEIAKITDKGGLVDFGGVDKLVQLMRPENTEKKLDLTCRTMLVDAISATDKFDCLSRFVQKGLPVLDEWLQEIHKGKIGDGSPKENDKSVEEFLFSILCALDKLPVNLHALQACNVGKSVNHLRSHKNSEIQKKAMSLVSTWKRRVEAEMNIIETKSNTIRGGSLPNKQMISEVSHIGGTRRIGSSSEVGPKSSASQPPPLKAPQPKQSSGEAVTKSPTSPASTKLSPSSVKEGRSCSSSQSPNNSQSCSSDHGKTGASSVSKISSSDPHSKSSGNGFHGSAVLGAQKEAGKTGYLSRSFASEKGSPTRHSTERVSDASLLDNGNSSSLIVRLPNTARSPTQTASLESPEDPSTISGKGSLPVPSKKQEQKVSGKFDSLQGNNAPNPNPSAGNDLSRGKEGPIISDEEHGKKDASGSSSVVTPQPGKLYEPSYSSINALVESCAKFSEATVSQSIGDVGGINLLASVAAGEMSRSDVSPACSPDCSSPVPEDLSAVNAAKSRPVTQDGGRSEGNINAANGDVLMKQIGSVSGDNSNTASVNRTPEVKPAGLMEDATYMKPNSRSLVEEDKCPDDKPTRNSVGLLDAAATSVKPETSETNEKVASLSSSDMHGDDKTLMHKRLTDQPVATTCGDIHLTPKSEETDDKKAHGNLDSGTSVSERVYENTEKDNKSSVVALQEVRNSGKATDVTEANCVEDRTVKLDFDLNEVLPCDDGIQCDVEKVAAIHAPNPLPSNNKSWSGLITIASAAKGSFNPSEILSRGKPELGWKGSAATSAFRPAEPRKADVPVPDSRTSKPTRALFDFDLNIGVEDANQPSASSGLDLDLNACEESPEAAHLSVSTSNRSSRSALPAGLNSSRDFDLNGPGMEEVGGESVTYSKNGVQFISGVPNVRMNNMDIGNFSTWFPPNNSYQAITIPSQRMLTPVTSSTSLNPDMFRGPVLSSSPAVAFPSTVPYQYSAFPFETNFSLPSISNTYPSVSNAYVDSSSSGGGPLCFPAIPPVGPNGVVSMPYRPYYLGLPGGSGNVGPDGRKWGSQGLDLNAGPGDDKLATTLRQLPLGGGGDEQLRMFHQMAAGGGSASKRKEPDGSWDGDNRISYKHPHRQ